MPGGCTFGSSDMEIHFVEDKDIEGDSSIVTGHLGDLVLQNQQNHDNQVLMLTHVADEAAYLLRLFLEGESCAWDMTVHFLRHYPAIRGEYGSPDAPQ